MTQDKKSPIPLYSFTQWNNSKNVPTLLTAGADFMEQDDFGRTPLHLVASSGNLANVQALLGVGADLMARDKWGKHRCMMLHCRIKHQMSKPYWLPMQT